MSTEAKNVSHARGITDVVVFVFKPRKFDDLHFPLHVNSSIFLRLESSFLLTFARIANFRLTKITFVQIFWQAVQMLIQKSAIFRGKFLKQRPTFVKTRFNYFAQYCMQVTLSMLK